MPDNPVQATTMADPQVRAALAVVATAAGLDPDGWDWAAAVCETAGTARWSHDQGRKAAALLRAIGEVVNAR